jgi:hypothetical protein
MSLFYPAKAKCFKCSTETEVQLAASVNAERRPDLRAAILDRSFQATDCPNCGTRMRLPAHMSYTDQKRGEWILVDAPERAADPDLAEADARRIFGDLYGAGAPDVAQEIGRDLKPRLVFGWPALREKLFCSEYALDDVVLELLKIAILRNVPKSPLSDATELRLVGAGDGALKFAWFESVSEQQISVLDVPHDIYDDIAADAAGWAALRGQLDGQYYVDFKRLLVA